MTIWALRRQRDLFPARVFPTRKTWRSPEKSPRSLCAPGQVATGFTRRFPKTTERIGLHCVASRPVAEAGHIAISARRRDDRLDGAPGHAEVARLRRIDGPGRPHAGQSASPIQQENQSRLYAFDAEAGKFWPVQTTRKLSKPARCCRMKTVCFGGAAAKETDVDGHAPGVEGDSVAHVP